MVSNIKKIFLSELKLVFKDQGSFLIMAFAVVLYSLFYTIPFAMQTVRNVPIGVIDNDNSSFSREFIRDLNATEYVQIVKHEKSIEEAKNDYYKNTVRAFVLIPKDFERAFGVQRQNVGSYLKAVIKNGSVVSNRLVNIGNGRQGYERVYEYKGNYYTMTGIGTNGFIVSAYPIRKDDL